MTKRQRTLLFYALTALFLLLAPAFALYSQGYRVNVTERRITQTGAFFFKVDPRQADIAVAGELKKRTDFFFGSTLIKNFFAKNYEVEITKEGYRPWRKTLPIVEQNVTEAKFITLFKNDIGFTQLAQNVERVWMAPSRQAALVLQETDASWKLLLFNLATGTSTLQLEPQRPGETIVSIQWSSNSGRFLVLRRAEGLTLADVHGIGVNDPCSETACSLSYLGAISDIRFSPVSTDIMLFLKAKETSQIAVQASYITKEPFEILASNVIAYDTTGSTLVWLGGKGTLWQRELSGNSQASLFQESAFQPKSRSSYALIAIDNIVLVKEDATLFYHEKGAPERTELLSPVTTIVLDPRREKVALANDSELWVLFLKEDREQPKRRASELILLTRFSETIQNLSWLNPHYLLFSLGGTIQAAEIDNRDKINTAVLGTFTFPTVFSKNNILYVQSQGTLSASNDIVR